MKPTSAQKSVLRFASEAVGPVARTDIVAGTGIQSRYMTATIAACVSKGWFRVTEDETGYWYSITDTGRAVLK